MDGDGILFHHFCWLNNLSKLQKLDPTATKPPRTPCRDTIVLPTAILCSDHGSATVVHCDRLSGLSGLKKKNTPSTRAWSFWLAYLPVAKNPTHVAALKVALSFDQTGYREIPCQWPWSTMPTAGEPNFIQICSQGFKWCQKKPWRCRHFGPWWCSRTTVTVFNSCTTFQWKNKFRKKAEPYMLLRPPNPLGILSFRGDLSVDLFLSCT